MPYNDAPTEIHMSIRNTGMYRYVPVCTSTYEYVHRGPAQRVRSGGEQRGAWVGRVFVLVFPRLLPCCKVIVRTCACLLLCCTSFVADPASPGCGHWSTQLLGRVLNKLMSPRANEPEGRRPSCGTAARAPCLASTTRYLCVVWHYCDRLVGTAPSLQSSEALRSGAG